MGHAPPVTRLALAFGVGAAWVPVGVPLGVAPLAALAFLLAPSGTSRRPVRRGWWLLVAVAALATAPLGLIPGGCLPSYDGETVALDGRFLAAPRGGSGPFVPASGCGTGTVVFPDSVVPAGRPGPVSGVW